VVKLAINVSAFKEDMWIYWQLTSELREDVWINQQ
jgi:hypothetical protein